MTILCLFLSAHFAVAYATLTTAMVPFDPYRDVVGRGGPFAYRMLPVLLWRACSFLLRPLSQRYPNLHFPVLNKPFTNDQEWFVVLLTFFAMFATLQASRQLLRAIAGEDRPWAFEWIALGMAYVAYFDTVLVLNRNLYYPYDLLALFFFTWLVGLAYLQRTFLFMLLLVPAMLNKETAIAAVLVYFGLSFRAHSRSRVHGPRRYLVSGGLLAVGVAVRMAQRAYIASRCVDCAAPVENQFRANLHQLVNPLFWLSDVAVFGFAYVAAILIWRFVPREVQFTALAVSALWVCAMTVAGVLREVRIFSELSALLLLVVGTGVHGWLVSRRASGSISGRASGGADQAFVPNTQLVTD